MKRIIFTVTNDLSYDQRMQRICTSLASAGFRVSIVGRKRQTSITLEQEPYRQTRLNCWFSKGKLMYLEFNTRLFFYLLFQPFDAVCAIDLDTILACYFSSVIKRKKRVYDAHELFTEQKEIVTRQAIQQLWLTVERFAVPKFKRGYTVNKFIADELNRRYGVKYSVVKNLPTLKPLPGKANSEKFIIYQGAVNKGRSFETLIPAMKKVEAKLVVCGEGNYFDEVKKLVKKQKLSGKVELRGYVSPTELAAVTPTAHVAVTLFENVGLNQYHSLANRFFDYIMAGVPQVCVGYPEYEAINNTYDVAYLVYSTDEETIATALNNLLRDDVLYDKLRRNCLIARNELNWNTEEKTLIRFYHELFQS